VNAQSDIRRYSARAHSTDVFGRVLCNARNHHFVVDGPVENDCPGEEVSPAEVFLSGVASCGVELIQMFARMQDAPLTSGTVSIEGTVDVGSPLRPDLMLFKEVRMRFELEGVTRREAEQLVESFKGR
jgi:uncharacterized OsmC-like protein